jgi:predicted metal-dependent phosphoesterase TrpH
VFTEHDTLWDEKSLREIRERHEFLILAGVEISTDDGHILTFGIDKYVFGMHRSDILAKYVEQQDGAMVAAHPYRRQMPWYIRNDEEYEESLRRAARNAAYQFCDGLEELNGRGSDKENAFSKRLCDLMGMPGTAGTDSHAIQDVGKVATFFEAEIRDERDLIREVRAGRFYAVDLRAGQAK